MADAVILDIAVINEAKAIMQAKFPTMVQYFLEDSASYMESIRSGITAQSAEKIISPAHTLKSSARQMGAMRLSEIAKSIELLAREQSEAGRNDMPPLAMLLEALEAVFAETRSAYQPYAA